MIHISQNIFETWKSNYELFSLVISWITWFLTVFFAAKSYFLEKKIWKMNIFHWKTYANRMSVFGTGEELFRIMFVNHSNVWPKEAMSIYFTYKTFIKDINTELGKNNAKIKEIWFITSEGLKISAKLYKKQLPWLNL